jgi:hypothetical protein
MGSREAPYESGTGTDMGIHHYGYRPGNRREDEIVDPQRKHGIGISETITRF